MEVGLRTIGSVGLAFVAMIGVLLATSMAIAAPPLTDEDCRRAFGCIEDGTCSAQDGTCVAKSSDDCRVSTGCARKGACSPMAGECVTTNGADCKQSSGCAKYGNCSVKAGVCGPSNNADCKQSIRCKENGECTFKDGECVIGGNADCRQITACKKDGVCTFKGDGCVVGDDADCKQSTDCKVVGDCTLRFGMPTWAGEHREYEICTTATDADCRQSEICREHGMCTAQEINYYRNKGKCVKKDKESLEYYRRYGVCGPLRCVVTSADCKQSRVCADDGRCTLKKDRCVVGSNADCKLSRDCAEGGQCTFKDGRCIATTNAECKGSRRCKERGACFLWRTSCRRVQSTPRKRYSPRRPAAPPAKSQARNVDWSKGIQKTGPWEYRLDRSMLDKELKDLTALSSGAKIVPNYVGGKYRGFRLAAVRPNSIYEAIGLQSGDTVTRINGVNIDSPYKAVQLLEKIPTEDRVQVDIIRRGAPRTITYLLHGPVLTVPKRPSNYPEEEEVEEEDEELDDEDELDLHGPVLTVPKRPSNYPEYEEIEEDEEELDDEDELDEE